MEHGFSPFGRTNYENALSAVPTIHHVIDRARIFYSHGAAWCHACRDNRPRSIKENDRKMTPDRLTEA